MGRKYCIVFRIRGEGVDRHHLSHIHVSYGEYEASYSIDGKLLAGELPNKKEKEVLEIIEQYRDELEKQLKCVEDGERVDKIF